MHLGKWEKHRAIQVRREVFEVTWLGLTRQPFTTEDGLTLRPRQSLAESRCDVCLVPGFWTESEGDVEAMLERQAELIAALRQARVHRYCGVTVRGSRSPPPLASWTGRPPPARGGSSRHSSDASPGFAGAFPSRW